MRKKVLVTGGAGYIGSHTVVELVACGYEAVLVDNFSNASPQTVQALRVLTGRELPFIEGDIRDGALLDGVFGRGGIAAVIHFAALKATGDSFNEPLEYYANNVSGTITLAERMRAHGVRTLVFSSSAAVYGVRSAPAETASLTEASPTQPTSPYGRSKLHGEWIFRDLFASEPGWRISILRYFNAVGAHPSGRLGEYPSLQPKNLLPRIGEVASGRRERLEIFGADYPTPDGTCVRDYLHVVDLARAHVKALRRLETRPGLLTHNLGSGHGHSVLELVRAFERASGRSIPFRVVERRKGDVAVLRADSTRARHELGWTAGYDLARSCTDYWRWRRSWPDAARRRP